MGDFNCRVGISTNKKHDDEISKGGKILLKMAKKYELCVVNKEDLCTGTWTRILGEEKSALDFILIRDDDRKLLQSMSIDEKKEKTPLWITKDATKRKIYTDHCMYDITENELENQAGR